MTPSKLSKTEATKPVIAILSDMRDQKIPKTVWSLLAGHDVRIEQVKDIPALQALAPSCHLILIAVSQAGDEGCILARQLVLDTSVVADVIAIRSTDSQENALKITSYGFDSVFDFENPEFLNYRQIILNKLEKARLSFQNRIKEQEYGQFKAALNASPDAIIIFDKNNKISFLSDHYRRAYPEAWVEMVQGMDVIGAFDMSSREEGLHPTDPRYPEIRAFWERLEGQSEYETGNGRTWRVKAAKLSDGQGTIVTTTDITSYRRTQAELEVKSKALEDALRKEQEASALQKQFIAMVSHEFKTPLTIIDSHAQIMMRRPEELTMPDIKRRNKTIRSAVSRLITLMDGIMSSNMLKSGKLDLLPQDVDLKSMINELCEDHVELARGCEITAEAADLPDSMKLDKKIVTLILSNLLSNAIKYTQGDPKIAISAMPKALEGIPGVLITVTDNGVGIPEAEIGSVFDRYYRASTASGIPGTGIGLSLVKELAALARGTIAVESTLGQGSKFSVFLPFLS